jgi:hypothetical protein
MIKLLLWNISYMPPDDGSGSPQFSILDLGEQAQAEWIVTVLRLGVYGDALPGGSVFTHDGDQREYRGNFVRIFYKCLPHRQIIIERWQEIGQDDKS